MIPEKRQKYPLAEEMIAGVKPLNVDSSCRGHEEGALHLEASQTYTLAKKEVAGRRHTFKCENDTYSLAWSKWTTNEQLRGFDSNLKESFLIFPLILEYSGVREVWTTIFFKVPLSWPIK